jgi:hypothetical protein
MDNYLYVSRAANWIDRHDSIQIYEYEWQNYVKNDPELEPVPNNSNTVNYLGETICWAKGKIFCFDPDEIAFYKMLEIANTIDACVCGGDGRQYFSIDSYFYPNGISKPETRPPLLKFEKDRLNKRRPWWKRLLNIVTIK